MHLRRLRLTNFRSCRSTDISFDKTLTVLAGENNAGKTNVIDALRLVTAPSEARRTRFVGPEDLRLGATSLRIEVDFAELDAAQCGIYFSALRTNGATDASWQYTWSPPTGAARRRSPTWTVGPRAQPETESDVRDLVRHVHLHALRDADRDLASSSPGRIEFLLRQLLLGDGAKLQALLKSAKVASDAVLREAPLQDAQSRVRNAFSPLAEGFYPHQAHLRFAEPTLVGLARDLRFALVEHGLDPAALVQTGLGYANLLYLSSVLVELEAAKDAELTLLLVEEPEAHLHPQLQRAVLSLLDRRARESERQSAPGSHAGQIQVVVTTHSPNLTAATSVRRIVVLRSSKVSSAVPTVAQPGEPAGSEPMRPSLSPLGGDRRDDAEGDARGPSPATSTPPASSVDASFASSLETVAVAIADLKLGEVAERKIDRYLDVTRASLLFGQRVLLVEGMAEALLMPAFAACVLDKQEFARFKSATVIAIDGVDFEPYVRLLLGRVEPRSPRIADRVVVLTDEDPDQRVASEGEGESTAAQTPDGGVVPAVGPPPVEATQAGPSHPPAGEARAQALRDLATELGATDRLHVAITGGTLEASLVSDPMTGESASNVMKQAFVECVGARGRAAREREWTPRVAALTLAERGPAFVKWMTSTGTRKGDLAQILAGIIERDLQTEKRFPVPPHITAALRALVAET